MTFTRILNYKTKLYAFKLPTPNNHLLRSSFIGLLVYEVSIKKIIINQFKKKIGLKKKSNVFFGVVVDSTLSEALKFPCKIENYPNFTGN